MLAISTAVLFPRLDMRVVNRSAARTIWFSTSQRKRQLHPKLMEFPLRHRSNIYGPEIPIGRSHPIMLTFPRRVPKRATFSLCRASFIVQLRLRVVNESVRASIYTDFLYCQLKNQVNTTFTFAVPKFPASYCSALQMFLLVFASNCARSLEYWQWVEWSRLAFPT